MESVRREAKAAFLDFEGTLVFEPPDTEGVDPSMTGRILPGVVEGLKRLQAEGYRLVLIPNREKRGEFMAPGADLGGLELGCLEPLQKEGIRFHRIFFCPHGAREKCPCRKPGAAVFKGFLRREKIDPELSVMVGDREVDVQFARKIGVWGLRKQTNGPFPRLASSVRTSRETDIWVRCNLDGQGHFQVETGLPFFNHMLEQFSRHSLIDLRIRAKGDLHIDEHHLVEDVGLTLGKALSRALGPRTGISRYGFLLPMDDTLAEVAVDLGGRPYLVFHCEFTRERVGDLPTEMVEHFLRSLSDALRANIHVQVRYSRNEHHKIEAIFKALGRALRMACEHDPRMEDCLPSTKGIL